MSADLFSNDIDSDAEYDRAVESMDNLSSSGSSFTTDALFQIFTESNIVIILWFLAVYFVVYILLGIFRGSDSIKPSISRWIDIVSLLILLVYFSVSFFAKNEKEKTKMVSELYENFKTYLNNPISLISVGFFILTLYIVIYILELPMDSGKPIVISIVENAAWLLFVIILIAACLRYIAGVSVGEILDKTSKSITPPVSGNTAVMGNTVVKPAAPAPVDEVFNIGNNMYTYDDAQSVCKSLNARLANYDEIEAAYNNGADGQKAKPPIFPRKKILGRNFRNRNRRRILVVDRE